MAKKKSEETNKDEETGQLEQSIWSVRINTQLLYKKAVDGRTILLGVTPEEKDKVAEVLDKAIDDLVKILEKRTTTHEAPSARDQVTRVDTPAPKVTDENGESSEENSETDADLEQENAANEENGKEVNGNEKSETPEETQESTETESSSKETSQKSSKKTKKVKEKKGSFIKRLIS